MKNMFKRIATAALAVALAANIGVATASAADSTTLENGTYEGTVHFYKDKTTEFTDKSYSMCDALFAHTADITLTEKEAKIDVYAVYPVPSFPDGGKDGTLKNMVMTINGTNYEATSDITSKPEKTFDTTNLGFGIKAGDKLPTQKLTFTLPREAVDQLEKGVATKGFVNVVMNMDVKFVVRITDLTSNSTPAPTPTPDEETQKGMTVTAEVAAPAATYTVTIPESITLGTLSSKENTVFDYEVKVAAANMGSGYVEVSTAADGKLTSGQNELAFTNSFGTQKASADATLKGSFTVAAEAVKAAAAGNYTGTANFTIRYFAGE